MMYVSQVIMLYTMNLYSAVCQLYLNKTGFKKRKKKLPKCFPRKLYNFTFPTAMNKSSSCPVSLALLVNATVF